MKKFFDEKKSFFVSVSFEACKAISSLFFAGHIQQILKREYGWKKALPPSVSYLRKDLSVKLKRFTMVA